MGKVVQLRRQEPRTGSDRAGTSMPGPLLYAPALMFTNVTVPLWELAEAVKERSVAAGKMPDFQEYVTFHDQHAEVIAFPMQELAFLKYGGLVMHRFYEDVAMGGSVEDGNEFMLDYPSGPPADVMFATLFLSPNQGKKWVDACNVVITTGATVGNE